MNFENIMLFQMDIMKNIHKHSPNFPIREFLTKVMQFCRRKRYCQFNEQGGAS